MYLERAVNALRERGAVDDALLGHIAPLDWNHIGFTGEYNWHANKRVAKGDLGRCGGFVNRINGRCALTIAVGTLIAERPPPKSRRAQFRTGLPPRVIDDKAVMRPRVDDASGRQELGHELSDPSPRRAIPLAAPPKRTPP